MPPAGAGALSVHLVGVGTYILGDSDILKEIARSASIRQDSLVTNGLVQVTLGLPQGCSHIEPASSHHRTCSSELQKLLGEEPCDAIVGWGWGAKKSFTIQFLKHEVKVTSMELQSARLQSAHKPFRLRRAARRGSSLAAR